MMIREYDISVAGMFGLAGCVAVLTGVDSPALGLALALGVGLLGGAAQGLIVVWLRIGAVAVTLGGLLTFVGLAYVLTKSTSVSYPNMEVALALNERIAGVFSLRSLVAIAIFALAAGVLFWTRIGRDILAAVNVNALLVGTFAVSGLLAALSGALLSYSHAAASPSGLSDVLVPATAAAILGGVSIYGGTGKALGIAAGMLTLAVLRAGLNALGAPPYMNDIATGAILLAVALVAVPGFTSYLGTSLRSRRWWGTRRRGAL